MASKSKKTIAVVGLWHLGSVYLASLAKLGFKVTGYDLDTKVINNFKKGIPPLFEPKLQEFLTKFAKNISYTSKESDLKGKDYIYITHDLVVDAYDVGEVSIMKKLFTLISKYCNEKTIVVISSQVPAGTSRLLVRMLERKGIRFPKVIYFPENLRLGTAFDSFLAPDRVIIGSDSKEALEQFKKDFDFGSPIITMGLESAELVKHALNCYLATCISLSSELSDVAELVGANMNDVVKALKLDKRVSQFAPINPGLGFAGGTLGRDIQSIKMITKPHKYTPKLLDAVNKVNQDRLPHVLSKIRNVYPALTSKKIGMLGLTYKPNTNTLRRSMAIWLAEMLHAKGAVIKAYDPVITSKIKEHSYIQIATSVELFAQDLDMIVLMTDWKEFLDIDVVFLSSLLKHKVIVDTKNFLDRNMYEKLGFRYIGIGI